VKTNEVAADNRHLVPNCANKWTTKNIRASLDRHGAMQDSRAASDNVCRSDRNSRNRCRYLGNHNSMHTDYERYLAKKAPQRRDH